MFARRAWASVVSTRRFSGLPRKDFKRVDEDDTRAFEAMLGPSGVVLESSSLAPMNRDWMKRYHGRATVALRPSSTSEVSQILKYCNERSIAVVPQGGNTGLVGGSVPVHDEVILSLGRMTKVLGFDATSGVLQAQAGCILDDLCTYLEPHGRTMPLDLGASGSCHIGGNVATNAGGIRLVRYGSLRNTVLGLEVVLANGEVLDLLTSLRKDNTGYDLKQLFIGSEGTLGVVTAVSVLTPAVLSSRKLLFLGCPSFDAVLEVYLVAQRRLGEILSAVEYLDRASLETAVSAGVGRDPMRAPHPYYLVLETTGANADHDRAQIESFVELAAAESLIGDGVVAESQAQFEQLWRLREEIAPSLSHGGNVAYKYDLSVPQRLFPVLVSEIEALARRAGDDNVVRVLGYGHIGDGNLHLNVIARRFTDATTALLEPRIFELVAAHRGSISAEHGIGQGKAKYLHYSKSRAAIGVMRQVKAVLDPRGILNPYKVLPGDE